MLLLAAPGPGDRAFESSIRQLRQAVQRRAGSSQLPLLASLRQLRDPTLRPFFNQLVQHHDPLVRVHAILGLAETDASARIDPALIRGLDSRHAQYAVIVNALETELIDTAAIHELLAGEDLHPGSRALLLAALVGRGQRVDPANVARLADSDTLATAGLAACVLAQLGEGDALVNYQRRLKSLPADRRAAHLMELFDRVSTYGLSAVAGWVERTVQAPQTDQRLLAGGVSTVLALDLARGVDLWRRSLGDDPDYSRCVRFALLLLEAGGGVDAQTYDQLPADDGLIGALVRAGTAISNGSDPTAALIELLDLGHQGASSWALRAAGDLDHQRSAAVYLHAIDAVEGDPEGRDLRAQLAITATSRLFAIDPDALRGRLERAADDSLTQQVILMGLLDSRSPEAGEAAGGVKRIGFGKADSLAMLLIAKHAAVLGERELDQLGVIAAGGGRISSVLQAQTSWLYLKHTRKIERALSETFADTREP